MSRRMTLTVICDHCGRLSHHEVLSSGFHEQIFTMQPYPEEWHTVKREGGSKLSPVLDYCPACKDKPRKSS